MRARVVGRGESIRLTKPRQFQTGSTFLGREAASIGPHFQSPPESC